MKKNIIILFFILLGLESVLCANTPHLDLFNPYDWLITPPDRAAGLWQVEGAFEGVVEQKSFQAEEDIRGVSHSFRKRADVLQLYQDQQDFLAALKGPDYENALAQLSQQFNINDDDGTQGLFTPYGTFDMYNLMVSAYRYLPYGFILQLHFQILSYRLKNVSWKPSPLNTNTTFENEIFANEFVNAVAAVSDMNLYDWHRAGFSDSAVLIRWAKHFPQARPWLQDAYLSFRAGLTIPTGKHSDPNLLLGLPLGNDGGVGVIMAGTIEMFFRNFCLLGVDAELFHLSGDTRVRNVKTDVAQTDLLFLNRACVFFEPGFTQHFSLYGQYYFGYSGISCMAAYQYTKQEESKVYFTTDIFDTVVANTAESLRSWTTHVALFSLEWDFCRYNGHCCWQPLFSLYFKWGFNGSRAIVPDTLTGLFTITF